MDNNALHLIPANRTLLSDQILQSIRTAIISGGLPPGRRLVEGELAETLQVSRGPVREALRRLEQEGLVRIVPAGGTFVATLTEEDIADIYGVRAAIEGYAARAVVNSRYDLTSLDLALSNMREALVQPELSTMIEADVLFHRTLVGLAQSKRLLVIWEGLEGQIRLILSLTRDQIYRDRLGLADQHASLVAALRIRDSGAAEAQIRDHIEGRIGERQMYWRYHQVRHGPVERPARLTPKGTSA